MFENQFPITPLKPRIYVPLALTGFVAEQTFEPNGLHRVMDFQVNH